MFSRRRNEWIDRKWRDKGLEIGLEMEIKSKIPFLI